MSPESDAPVRGSPPLDARARRRRRALGIAVVSLVPLLQLATQFVAGHDHGRLLTSAAFLVIGMPLLMAAYSLMYAQAQRRRFGPAVTLLSGVVLACLLGPLLGAAMWELNHYVTIHPRPDGPWKLERAVLYGFTYALFAYGLWALAFVFPFAIDDARVRSLEADKLRLEAEKLRTSAELARLRAHLQPHFLLNTLNAIAGLVTEDPREARRLLVALGDLLRDALRDENEMQTLSDQIAWLQRYAEILEARHPGRLVFRWEVAEEAREMMLPRLLLQPLVENAVKHGALKRPSGGTVVVRASLRGDDEKVVCTIEDDGPGVPDSETRSGAFGLRAVRRRLELRWAQGAELRLESTDGGTRSVVEFPPQRRLAAEAS